MMIGDTFGINRKYLEEMDKFIAKNYQILTCGNIHDIYFDFLQVLKEFRGTSTGFTGLSELLIFRFLCHQLGGFEPHSRSHDTKEFVSESHTGLRIAQEIPVNINERKTKPDISIYHNEHLIAVIQIKVYLTRGLNTITKEIEILEQVKTRTCYQKLQALLIMFRGPSPKSESFNKLEGQKNTKEWFNFLILEENKELLTKKLHQYLSLERIMPPSLDSG